MNKKISIATLIAFVLGIIGGLVSPETMLSIDFLGTIYVNLLKMMIIPVLSFGIISALTSNEKHFTSKITINSILLFVVMFVVSFIINSCLVMAIKPGVNFNFTSVEWTGELADASLKGFLTSIFPTNIIQAAAENSILPVILFAFVVGIAINSIPNSMIIKSFIDSMNQVFNKILSWIMVLTPIGVLSLMGTTMANYGLDTIKIAGVYVGCAWLGCAVIAIIVMMLPLWICCHINPIQYLKKISEIWIMTISTCSSAATLPNTIRVCREKFNVPESITNIVVPLGCTIHMCGGAVSFSLLALFTMELCGITSITPYMWLLMIITALLINMGAPGIPGGGIVIGATYLTILGLPLEFIGFYAGIYKLLDMAYTTMNVSGDITANCLINKSLK